MRNLSEKHQTLLFSATMPEEIEELAQVRFSNNYLIKQALMCYTTIMFFFGNAVYGWIYFCNKLPITPIPSLPLKFEHHLIVLQILCQYAYNGSRWSSWLYLWFPKFNNMIHDQKIWRLLLNKSKAWFNVNRIREKCHCGSFV